MTSPAVTAPSVAARRADPVQRSRHGLLRKQKQVGWFLLLPALVHSAIFITIPTIAAIVLAFTDYNFAGTASWIGFGNFVELFHDEHFKTAVIHTAIYVVVVVPVAMALSLLVALGLNQKLRGLAFFRTAFYVPTVTATVAVGMVWLWIYNPGGGLANAVLGLLGVKPIGWLTSPTWALPSLMVIGVWQGIGAKMLVYLAALQGVPRELVEAASLDGANKWQSFWAVTWPSIGPAQFFVLITAIVSTFQVFDLVYVTTRGGPGLSTNVLVFDVFQNAFQSLRLGYASAETVMMMILIGAFIFIGRKLQGAGTHE